MEKIVWKTERRKVKDLIPAGYNPRKILAKQREDLMASIREFSEVEPVVINLDNKLIGGHQRLGIYADLGIEEIDVRVPNRQLTIDEEVRLNLRLNKNTGEWDNDKLAALDIDMLLDVGFEQVDLSSRFDNTEVSDDGFDNEKAVEKAKNTKIKLGDIFQLGEHRLMCGDSTNHEQIEKLLNGHKADMVYSDPPYNIGLNYSKGIGTGGKYQGKEKSSIDDSKTTANYSEFLQQTMQAAIANAQKNVHLFYWCDEKYIWLVQTLFEKLGAENKRVCLWIKNNQNPTPGLAFNKVYEPCVYATIGRPFLNPNYRALNEVLNKEVGTGNQLHEDILDLLNIWIVKRVAGQSYDHPTEKPVTLHEKALKRCTAPGGVVLDSFGGSGSTLMACEQIGRKAHLMEINPIFCQVIIDRWEAYSGEKVSKIGG